MQPVRAGLFFEYVRDNERAISALSTVAVAAFTIVLAVATIFLWWATRRLVRGAEQTAERQLRAYVSLPTVEIQNFGAGRQLEIVISVLNSGQTPAYRVRCKTAAAINKFPDDDAPIFGPHETGNGYIGPSANLITGITLHEPLSEQQATEITAGILAIYVRAKIVYWDAFGKVERYVNYRGFHKRGAPSGMPNIGPNGELMLQQTNDGNDAN